MNPENTSVIINPTIANTKTVSFGTKNKLVKIKIAVSSRVPNPAKVIGMNPTVFATGYKTRKRRYGMLSPSASATIYP